MPMARIGHKDNLGRLNSASSDKAIRAHPQVRAQYGFWLDRYPGHEVVVEGGLNKILRWRANRVVECMIDRHVNLNRLWEDFHKRCMPVEDMATVYRMMGYSLRGFEEVFGDLLEPREMPTSQRQTRKRQTSEVPK